MVTFDEGTMVQSHPIALRNGDYLLGVYHETGGDRESVGPDTSSFFLRLKKDKTGDTAAYPVAIQSSDGSIHVLYTSERLTMINHAIFDEAAILNQQPQAAANPG